MSEKTNTIRVSLDMSNDYHKHLKAIAALQGKTIRQIILESIEKCLFTQITQEKIAEHERWLYDPANKAIVEHIKEGLKQKATIYRRSFAKRAKL
jgi:predicted DNA-binding protein